MPYVLITTLDWNFKAEVIQEKKNEEVILIWHAVEMSMKLAKMK